MIHCNIFKKYLNNLREISPIERDLYIRQLASETNISEEAIYAQFRKLEADNAKQQKRTQQMTQPKLTVVQHRKPSYSYRPSRTTIIIAYVA